MEAALVTAWGMAVAGVIGAMTALVKIVFTRPRVPVAEEVLQRLTELEEALLTWATWAHGARMAAASAGITLPAPPLDPAERRQPHRLPPRLGPDTNPLPRTGAHRG